MLITAIRMSEIDKLKTLLRRKFDKKYFGCVKGDSWDGEFPRTNIPQYYGYLSAVMLRRC